MAQIAGTPNDDVLTGGPDADTIDARSGGTRAGSDRLFGGGGDDFLLADTGTQDSGQIAYLDGGDGNDLLYFGLDNEANRTRVDLLGGAGDDRFELFRSTTRQLASEAVNIDGGDGFDTVVYAGPASAALMAGWTLNRVERLNLSDATVRYAMTAAQVNGVGGGLSIANGAAVLLTLTDAGAFDFSRAYQAVNAQASAAAVITGSAFNDVLAGSGGSRLSGGAGDDTLTTAVGDLLVDGGAGFDTWSGFVSSTGGAFRASDAASAAGLVFGGATIRSVERTTNLTIQGADNTIRLDTGGHTLTVAGTGNTVRLEAGGSNVTASGAGALVYSSSGDDTVRVADGAAAYMTIGGRDLVTGGTANVVDYSAATGAVRMLNDAISRGVGGAGYDYNRVVWVSNPAVADLYADMTAAQSRTTLTFGSGTVIGSAFDDLLTGDAISPVGFGAAFRLSGGAGNDVLVTGNGDDVLDGGEGIDTISFDLRVYTNPFISTPNQNGANIDLALKGPQNTNYGMDTVLNVENVIGSRFADRISGSDVANRLDGGAGNDVIFGRGGDDFIIGGLGDDVIDGGSGFDTVLINQNFTASTFSVIGLTVTVSGADGTDRYTDVERYVFNDVTITASARDLPTYRAQVGTAGNDVLTGDAGRDVLIGGAGNDVLNGGFGDDALSGGAGIDTAIFGWNSRASTIVYGAGSGMVTGPEGADTLTGIEILRFLDGRLTSDPSDIAAQLYRLYDAAFDRGPDDRGFKIYLDALQRGATLVQLTDLFAQSAEFASLYGGTSNQQFVERLYLRALDRAGDAGGVAYWTSQLDAGVSRSAMLRIFSESDEHRSLTSGVVSQGFWVGDSAKEAVIALYAAAFDRLPDGGALAYYSGVIKDVASAREVGLQLAASDEFALYYGGLTNAQFVDALYRNILNREADQGGRDFYIRQLELGESRGELFFDFAASIEHQQMVLSHINYGFLYG